ncbi:MAG: NnrU family protein [Rhizobiaceae bacterium]
MAILILGLVVFLGIHSVRVFADDWRTAQIAARGETTWKGLYTGASILGLVLLVYGFGTARETADLLYTPPAWGCSFLMLAMPIALVFFVASQLPMGNLKKRLGHPMLWGTVIWSAGHLLANGDTASVLLFGGFLIWAALDLKSAYGRPRGEIPAPKVWADLAALVIGFAVTAILVMFLHQYLFGVPIV